MILHINGYLFFLLSKVDQKLSECLPGDNEEDLIKSQIELLKTIISLDDSNYKTRKKICDTIQSIFTPNSPDSVHIFGSSKNGLGVKGCDLDIFLELPGIDYFFQLDDN